MLGHEIRLTQTNTYGWVPLCECGWIGAVVPHVSTAPKESARSRRVAELTQSIARTHHGAHLHDVRVEAGRQGDRALALVAKANRDAHALFDRPGRWGRS